MATSYPKPQNKYFYISFTLSFIFFGFVFYICNKIPRSSNEGDRHSSILISIFTLVCRLFPLLWVSYGMFTRFMRVEDGQRYKALWVARVIGSLSLVTTVMDCYTAYTGDSTWADCAESVIALTLGTVLVVSHHTTGEVENGVCGNVLNEKLVGSE